MHTINRMGKLPLTATLLSALTFAAVANAQEAPVTNGVSQVNITLVSDDNNSCKLDYNSAKAGPVTFRVTNETSTAITEVELLNNNRIMGEKENLAPGLPTVQFTLTLGGGEYQVYCPGAETALQTFTVTGKAAPRPTGSITKLLDEGTAGYAEYTKGVVADMKVAVDRLKADIDAGDLAKAKHDYPLARPFYEKVESDVDGFVLPGFDATDNSGNLDYLIDMRASNIDPKVGWHGFHAIERDLFERGAITDQTKAYAAELQQNVNHLNDVINSLDYLPEDLANGAADLLEEVQTTKITGEEEEFSHYDLVDFAANVEGAQQAFAYLQPGMEKIDPELTKRVSDEFAKVNTELNKYRDPSVPGGYQLYTDAMKQNDAAKLSRLIQSLQEPLALIAEKVATADGGAN